MGAFGNGFVTHEATGLFEQRYRKGCAQGGAAREAGSGHTGKIIGAADAIGAIGEPEGGNTMLREALGMPEVDSFEMLVCA